MEAKELNFRGFKANGFLMLAMHLLLISVSIRTNTSFTL